MGLMEEEKRKKLEDSAKAREDYKEKMKRATEIEEIHDAPAIKSKSSGKSRKGRDDGEILSDSGSEDGRERGEGRSKGERGEKRKSRKDKKPRERQRKKKKKKKKKPPETQKKKKKKKKKKK